MKILSVGKSVAGQGRDHNEDLLLLDNTNGIYIVADGVGGHEAGEVASRLTVEGIVKHLKSSKKINDDALISAIREANSEVYRKSSSGEKSMASTVVMIKFVNGKNFIYAHVGDSRLYHIRGLKIEQRTSDHSWVNEQVKANKISEEEAMFHPKKNIITRAMGSSGNVQPDIGHGSFKSGDGFLLCSDGLSDVVRKAEIYEAFQKFQDRENLADYLINMAVKKGSKDDITLIILEVQS